MPKQLLTALDTPWKVDNQLRRWLALPRVWLVFALNSIPWRHSWRIYGAPIIQKHRSSHLQIGAGLQLRSTVRSNPLAPTHPVVLTTLRENAVLNIGDCFSMTGGSICAAQQITIGDRVTVGANSTIMDTDFHPLDPEHRWEHPQNGKTAPVSIEDDVFIGMNCLILKGVTIGQGSVIGAGSAVTQDVPPYSIAAGNPARIVGSVQHKLEESACISS